MPEADLSSVPGPEELVDRYQRRIYAVIYRMTGRHADTDDLCQEAFLQIFRSLPRFRPGTNLDSWVYRIAMNVSVDHLRRRGRDAAAREELGRTGPAVGGGAAAIDAETADAVRKAVEELPPQQKAVVVLRLFEGLGHDEIGEILETPAATVRWRLFTALEKLELLLGPLAGKSGDAR